jgi:hypothetical protein
MKRYHLAILVTLVLVSLAPDLFAQGCSQCRMIPASDMDSGHGVARNLNNGILYLMAVPYLFFGGIIFIYRKKVDRFLIDLKLLPPNGKKIWGVSSKLVLLFAAGAFALITLKAIWYYNS